MPQPPTDPAATREVYRNSRYRRVRLLSAGFWTAGAAFLAAGLGLLAAGDRGDPTALLIIAPLLLAGAAGLEFYRSLYVTALVASPDGLGVETLAFIGRHVRRLEWRTLSIPTEPRILAARGQFSSMILIRQGGRALPFIVDTTADTIDHAAIRSMRRAKR